MREAGLKGNPVRSQGFTGLRPANPDGMIGYSAAALLSVAHSPWFQPMGRHREANPDCGRP